jgi:hypothetical protein
MFIVVMTRERNNSRKKKERRKVVSCLIKRSVFLCTIGMGRRKAHSDLSPFNPGRNYTTQRYLLQ